VTDGERLGVKFSQRILVFDVDKDIALAVQDGVSGLPLSDTVPTTFPVVASITVELALRPLKVKTRFVSGS
jgi:hypothetical protein